MLRFPKRRTPWLTARCLFFNTLLNQKGCQNDVETTKPRRDWDRLPESTTRRHVVKEYHDGDNKSKS
jgi:hypothetical protein